MDLDLCASVETDPDAWAAAMSLVLGREVSVRAVSEPGPSALKAHGMTTSIELELEDPSGSTRYFLKVPDESLYGEVLAADRERELAWRLEGYQLFPGHAGCLAIGEFDPAGKPMLRGNARSFVIEEWVPGEPLWQRLLAYADDADRERVDSDVVQLARHLGRIHVPIEGEQRTLYARALRDTLITPVLRLLDAYDRDEPSEEQRPDFEMGFISWYARLRERGDRLRRVHHDYHPWNIFIDGDDVKVIGARLPGYGEPSDDVASILANFLWFSYLTLGDFGGVYEWAFDRFIEQYVEVSEDASCCTYASPFLAKRLLVFLNRVYYPDVPAHVREHLRGLLGVLLDRGFDVTADRRSLRLLRR